MLQFVLGRAGSGKTEYMRRLLADRALAGQGGTVMLVPEQYTFETEKAMLRLAGPVRGNAIPVYSFTRLAEAVFRREGGAVGRRLSDGGRRILMASAIEACQDRLEVYAAAAQSGRVNDVMLTAVNEMKMCGIAPGDLREAARGLGGRGLGKKLSELALLYDTYNGLVEASYLDSRDDLTRLAQALEGSAFFQGCTVAVDSFEGFTAQELKVLVQILRQADQVVVALCTDGLDTTGTGLFALVDRTLHRLSAAARENGVAIQPPVVLTGAPRFQNENLKLVEAQLFCAQETLTSPDCQGIAVLEAKDPYEEAEFAAATIRRLVAEEGYRYREISIICRDPARYYGCLDAALKKRDIPCFVSQPAKVDGEPVTRFVLGAFQAVQGGYQTEDLLELLKTGVSGFTAEEIASLENYAYLWKLSGPGWRQEFTRHPRGFGQELTPEDQGELARLNGLRQRLMGPLERFAARTREATGGEISQAVYLLLLAFNLEETLPAYCLFLESSGEDALAQKQLRVWDLLMETLDQMRAILGDRPLSRERYAQLLKEVIAGEDVSEIPQTVDQVLFGTAEQVRQSAPRAVFLLGCAQGEFPLSPRSSGVFSDAERKEMLNFLGASSVRDLYSDLPEALKKKKFVLADGRSQQETYRAMAELADRNAAYRSVFRGAGSYRHYIPAAVKSVTTREEFMTAYTPYQPEISQGILQATFEFQTMMCSLTGMDVATASHYSGATAAAEACVMCAGKAKKVVTFDNVNPDTLDVIRTYLGARGIALAVLPTNSGAAELGDADGYGAVYVESPNYYGILEDIAAVAEAAKAKGAKVIAGCNPLSLALFKAPGDLGADVAVGDAQPFGMPLSFGGPYLGYMAAKKEFVRKLPGRIVGETTDADGRRAFVLTLQTREQHIRREKATSNICSNQAHCALTAAVYLSLVGPQGLRDVALKCASNAHYLARELSRVGAKLFYEGEFFHEFVTITPGKASAVAAALEKKGILGGLPIDEHRIIWCCTELNSKADMDEVVKTVEETL